MRAMQVDLGHRIVLAACDGRHIANPRSSGDSLDREAWSCSDPCLCLFRRAIACSHGVKWFVVNRCCI